MDNKKKAEGAPCAPSRNLWILRSLPFSFHLSEAFYDYLLNYFQGFSLCLDESSREKWATLCWHWKDTTLFFAIVFQNLLLHIESATLITFQKSVFVYWPFVHIIHQKSSWVGQPVWPFVLFKIHVFLKYCTFSKHRLKCPSFKQNSTGRSSWKFDLFLVFTHY